jgi:hypothetical protein
MDQKLDLLELYSASMEAWWYILANKIIPCCPIGPKKREVHELRQT